MAVSIKDLRYRTRQVLEGLKRGEKPIITYRGHAIARIVPLKKREQKAFNPIGFGIWKDHPDMKDGNRWLDRQRKPRYSR